LSLEVGSSPPPERSGSFRRALTLAVVIGSLAAACDSARPAVEADETARPQVRSISEASESLLPVLDRQWRVMLRPADGEIIGRVADVAVTDSFVLLADAIEADIKLFTLDGEHIRTFGRRGDGPAEFREPVAIVLAPAGDRFTVLDRKRGRVSHWTMSGIEQGSWSHGMLLANSMSSARGGSEIVLFGTSLSPIRRTTAMPIRQPIQSFTWNGQGVSALGELPPTTHAGEGTYRITVGAKVGDALVYSYSSTNRVWEVLGGQNHEYTAGSSFYQPWAWESRPPGDGSGRQDWMQKQVWTTGIISVDEAHYLVAMGFPQPFERTYHYRYVLMRVGDGEQAATESVQDRLLNGRGGMVYGVMEVANGGAILSAYRLIPDRSP
jgi:hypothetical protein